MSADSSFLDGDLDWAMGELPYEAQRIILHDNEAFVRGAV